MGPIWGRQDPGGPHVGPMNFAIWDATDQVYENFAWSMVATYVYGSVITWYA